MSELIGNRARRIATLKEIIQHLHQGEAPDAVKTRLRKIVRQTDASEIMAMEQELISGGMPVEEVRSMCDLHSQVTREVLVQLPASAIPAGHPVDTFRRKRLFASGYRGCAQRLRKLTLWSIRRMKIVAVEGAARRERADGCRYSHWLQVLNSAHGKSEKEELVDA